MNFCKVWGSNFNSMVELEVTTKDYNSFWKEYKPNDTLYRHAHIEEYEDWVYIFVNGVPVYSGVYYSQLTYNKIEEAAHWDGQKVIWTRQSHPGKTRPFLIRYTVAYFKGFLEKEKENES